MEGGLRDITGLLLVGGKSRRMGGDKLLLTIGGVPVWRRVLAVLRALFPSVLVVGDRPERFAGLDLPLLPDLYPGSSLGGLHAGLVHAPTPWVFVAAADIPFPSAAVIRHLALRRAGVDAVVPEGPRGPEPLFACYSRGALDAIEAALAANSPGFRPLLGRIRTRLVPGAEIAGLEGAATTFLNVNTPEEYEAARALAGD